MKIKSLSLASIAAAVLTLASCGTVQSVTSTMPAANLDLGSLDRNQYEILGTVSGEASLLTSSSKINSQNKSKALGEVVFFNDSIDGDDAKYGFVGSSEVNKSNMTAVEKAVANANYKMIELARYNKADAILYVNTTTEIDDGLITAKVSGLAVKIKADEGAKIKPLPIEKEAPAPAPQAAPKVEKEAPAAAPAAGEKAAAPEAPAAAPSIEAAAN